MRYEQARLECQLAHGTVWRLSDRVFFRQMDWDPTNQCNGGYLVFSSFVAAIDAPGEGGATQMQEEAQRLFGKPVKLVLLTHGHWDHADGLEAYADTDITCILSQPAYDRFLREGRTLPKTTVAVREATLRVEGLTLRLFMLPGTQHSGEDLFLYCPEETVLFTGDVAVAPPYLFMGNADLHGWRAALDSLAACGAETLCCGHGPLRGPSFFSEVAGHIEAVAAAADDVRQKAGGSLRGLGLERLHALTANSACPPETLKNLNELLEREL